MNKIGNPTKIAGDAIFEVSGAMEIEPYVVIGKGFKASCRSLKIGRHTYIGENVHIGGGGAFGVNSRVDIGPECCLADGSFINCASYVRIGRHVALGYETQIWTHSVWNAVVDGFPPQKQEPVWIGDNVWLPSRCQVLPGVNIGANTIVGMGSLVNRSLPAGCLAVGRPAKAIKERQYPRPITVGQLRALMARHITEYANLAELKGFSPRLTILERGQVVFGHQGESVVFDPWTKAFDPCPEISPYAEDFRDYLRRNGFPFYGGGFFESLPIVRGE